MINYSFRFNSLENVALTHCMKSVRFWSFSGPNAAKYGPENSEYPHFSRSERSIFFSFLFLFDLTISLLFKGAFYAKTRGMFRILSIISDGAFSRYYFCKRARLYKLGSVINTLLELYINELIFKHVSSFIISYFFYFFS